MLSFLWAGDPLEGVAVLPDPPEREWVADDVDLVLFQGGVAD